MCLKGKPNRFSIKIFKCFTFLNFLLLRLEITHSLFKIMRGRGGYRGGFRFEIDQIHLYKANGACLFKKITFVDSLFSKNLFRITWNYSFTVLIKKIIFSFFISFLFNQNKIN